MRNIRLKLSEVKGMSVAPMAQDTNEMYEMVNLKPTNNGLEMRNGAREVLADEGITYLLEGDKCHIADGKLFSVDSNDKLQD